MSKEGIDVRLALEILSQRSPEDHARGADGACSHKASEQHKALGQVIDLNPQEQEDINKRRELLEIEQNELAAEREKRLVEMKDKLLHMSVRELLLAVLEAQQQRVQTYHSYNSSLDAILCTRNLTTYPQLCAEATAQFAVVSSTILSIHSCLATNKTRRDLATLVHNLQQLEKEKLNLSAALHLERIRESQGAEKQILDLIQEGIQSLENKISTCEDGVNLAIEELQCALADEE
jgi:hypothetical protein